MTHAPGEGPAAGLALVIGNKNYSSWSFRAWLYLQESGIPFREIRVPLYTPEWDRTMGGLSPSGRVPVLVDGRVTVWETVAIFEYLRERCPGAVGWPQDPNARAVARAVSAEMHSGFLAVREEMPFNCRARLPGLAFTTDALEEVARVGEIWRTCRRNFGADGPWLFGRFSIADVMYAAVALRFVTYGVDLGEVERAYVSAVLDLGSVRRWLSEAEAEQEVIPQYERRPCS